MDLKKLEVGDLVNLINNENGVKNFNEMSVKSVLGVSKVYDFTIKLDKDNKNLIATLDNITSK